MSKQVIEIVNNARGRAGLSPLSEADYDSSIEREPLQARTQFKRFYQNLIDLRTEDLRRTFDISTVAGVNDYTLPFPTERLSNVSMRVIDPIGEDDYHLDYFAEDDILVRYPDLNDIEEGKPHSWFLHTTAIASEKKLSFVYKPDAIYIVQGFEQIAAAILTASDLTECAVAGDDYLEDSMYGWIRFTEGYISYLEIETVAKKALYKYLGQDHHINTPNRFPRPTQRYE